MIYSIIPNYGIAIIILTLLVRFLTLPVLQKSKKNSEKMKALGPKMQQIKERFPDDKARQSQEMMELYKRENFSPFSSFIPMLVQIPFFLAMYRVIYENFSLWRQPFFGWITDLSQPDTLISFNGFVLPLLNWTGINILPIVMLGTQFFSSLILTRQQQSQTNTAGSSKGMMLFLSYGFPVIIFFALYSSPSGLILYWIVSNVFTVFSMMDRKQSTKEIVANAKQNSSHTAKAKPKKRLCKDCKNM